MKLLLSCELLHVVLEKLSTKKFHRKKSLIIASSIFFDFELVFEPFEPVQKNFEENFWAVQTKTFRMIYNKYMLYGKTKKLM